MDFKADSLDWALAHILKYGDTDIFPVPFEYHAISEQWKGKVGVRAWMVKQDPGKWQCRAHRRCLVPKHRYGFRRSTQLDPFDSLAFAALVYDIGRDIEKARIPTAKEIVHSFRFSPGADGQLFDPKYGWLSFLAKSRALVENGACEYVVVADIADFYPRLYAHPLQNQLTACTSQRTSTAEAILGLLNQWNQTISYGLPVGPAASRLLAELALAIVDNGLVHAGATYCRFSDDFRIFCRTKREAHERLAFLAEILSDGLGVTLQQHKTRIISKEEFHRQLVSPRLHERARLSQQFEHLLTTLGLTDPYKKIDYDHLSPTKRAAVDALNLSQILNEQIKRADELDIAVTSFVLRRLAQLRDDAQADLVLDNLDILYPVFPDSVSYLASLDSVHGNRRRALGAKLLGALTDAVSAHLDYHRCWILNVFAESPNWDNEGALAQLEGKWQDVFTRRELILARGRAGHADWFKLQKPNVDNFGPWERRAFLYAASCLPGDEATHWWDAMKKRGDLDPLDRAVIIYAKNHPIR